jgi:hypothetical protein
VEGVRNDIIASPSMRVEQNVGPASLAGCHLPSLGQGKQLLSFIVRQRHKILLGHGALLFLVHYTGGKLSHQNRRGQPL